MALLGERLDQIDAWIEEGLLGGEELNAADFQIAPNVSALLLAEDLAPFVRGRPAEAWAARVAPGYVGHIGRVAPADWLAPLEEHTRRKREGQEAATDADAAGDDDWAATLLRPGARAGG
jgi:hypothetical protein